MSVYKTDKTLLSRAFVKSEVGALRTRGSLSSTSIQYIVACQSITRSDLESGKTDNCTETQSCHMYWVIPKLAIWKRFLLTLLTQNLMVECERIKAQTIKQCGHTHEVWGFLLSFNCCMEPNIFLALHEKNASLSQHVVNIFIYSFCQTSKST